jgi:glycosyltransferase involved in cell wall biosynthesis
MAGRPFIGASSKVVVADLYDPMHLEQLEQGKEAGDDRGRWDAVRSATAVLNEQLLRADFILCASEKQRDFWLGQLAGLGRINPATYDEDETLRSLVAVVPFGLPAGPPRRVGAGIRERFPQIEEGDPIILWGGGIYNWFDPLTLLHAIDRLRHHVPRVRLVFMGLRHPNPAVPEMRTSLAARGCAEELGLVGVHVFFNEQWVSYEDRQAMLLDATLGVSTHHLHIETAFSYRTRILDYFWAGLPVVATRGDSLSTFIEDHELGVAVDAGDVGGLVSALSSLLTDPQLADRCRSNIRSCTAAMEWGAVLEPLVAFCRSPRRAPDLADAELARLVVPSNLRAVGPSWRSDLRLARRYLSEGGLGLLVGRMIRRARRTILRAGGGAS